MTRTGRIALVVGMAGAIGLGGAGSLAAQDRVGGDSAVASASGPGWIFTPTFKFSQAYDDNITLFGQGTAEELNDDHISTIRPSADLRYAGRHTSLGLGYSSSFLNYRTFSTLNRWDQRARLEFRRQENKTLRWFGRANYALVPSTDLIDLAGIPFRNTAATTADGHGGIEISLGARNTVSSSVEYQAVRFDEDQATTVPDLRGGDIASSRTAYRRKLDERVAVGTDYTLSRSTAVGDAAEVFTVHAAEAAVDLLLSETWTFSGGGGMVHLVATPLMPAQTSPSWHLAFERHGRDVTFHAGFAQSYVPSFGYGGTIRGQEASTGIRAALGRHFYTDHSAVIRNDMPLTSLIERLPLRSLRTSSVFGWAPHPYVGIEAFYSRTQQTSLQPGGRLDRNRLGVQIVTSKPMRLQ